MSDLKNFEKSQALADCTSIEDASDDTAQRAHGIIESLAEGNWGQYNRNRVNEIELISIKNALEDGEVLTGLELTDDDQDAVEHAWGAVDKLIDMGFVRYSECMELLDTCYTVDDATTEVQEHLVIDLRHSIKTEYQLYMDAVTSVDSDDDGNEVDVTRFAVVRRKNFNPDREQIVGTFDDEDEAMEALSAARKELAGWYAADIYNDPDNSPFSTREAAEDVLSQASE